MSERIPAAACALLILFAATAARADPAVRYWELALPDVRYELDGHGAFGGNFTLAVPIDVAPWVIGAGTRPQRIPGGIPGTSAVIQRMKYVLVPELFVEPQYQINDGHWRGAGGVRLFAIHGATGAHVAVEAVGVVGQDGTGGGFGLGVGYGSVVTFGFRGIWTDDVDRAALIVDFRLFVLPLSQPQRTLDEIGRSDAALP